MSKSPASFPLSSYLLFGLRDGMTVTSTFVLKVRQFPCLPSFPPSFLLPFQPTNSPSLPPSLPPSPPPQNTVRDHLVDDYDLQSTTADLIASFAVPMLAQIPSAPLHILSMDLYLRKGEFPSLPPSLPPLLCLCLPKFLRRLSTLSQWTCSYLRKGE